MPPARPPKTPSKPKQTKPSGVSKSGLPSAFVVPSSPSTPTPQRRYPSGRASLFTSSTRQGNVLSFPGWRPNGTRPGGSRAHITLGNDDIPDGGFSDVFPSEDVPEPGYDFDHWQALNGALTEAMAQGEDNNTSYFVERNREQLYLNQILVVLVAQYYRQRYGPPLSSIPTWGQDAHGCTPLVLVDIFDSSSVWLPNSWRQTATGVARHIISQGYVPCRLQFPTVAFSSRCLEFYIIQFRHAQHLRQSFVRSICSYNQLAYTEGLRVKFSAAVVLFIEITTAMDTETDSLLKRGTSVFGHNFQRRDKQQDHHSSASDSLSVETGSFATVNHTSLEPRPLPPIPVAAPVLRTWDCPLCFRTQSAPADDSYEVCVALDGNNSLKRHDHHPSGKQYQSHTSNFHLHATFVDHFSYQTITHQKQAAQNERRNPRIDTPAVMGVPEGIPCASHWTAAKEKPMISKMFDASGWFPLVCRHGVVLAHSDMIKEHESSKFPLALLRWLSDRYVGRIAVGYDIGCTFGKTFAQAPLLKHLQTPQPRLSFHIGAWHGYAHSYGCQLEFHPRLTGAVGLEDFETCKRLFSFTNRMAGMSRHCTAFHRHQMFEIILKHWNGDKFANSATFLLANIRSAKRIRKESLATISRISKAHGQPQRDLAFYRQMIQSEQRTRANGSTAATLIQRRAQTQKGRFYNLAATYRSALRESNIKRQMFADCLQDPFIDQADQWTHLAQRASADDALVNARKALDVCLIQHQLQSRYSKDVDLFLWLDSMEGREAASDALLEAYEDSLDELEMSCIARMQGMDRSSNPGTSYSLRQKIQEGINRRSSLMETKYKKYQAARMALPEGVRPALIERHRWLESPEAVSESFACLRDQRHFGAELWTQPHVREGVRATRSYDCAIKELSRVETEAIRLEHFVIDQRTLLCGLVNDSPLPLDDIWNIDKNPIYETKPRRLIPAMVQCHIMERIKNFDVIAHGIRSGLQACRTELGSIPAPSISDTSHIREGIQMPWCRWVAQHSPHLDIFDGKEVPRVAAKGDEDQSDKMPAGVDEADPVELAGLPGISEESYAVL